MARVNRPLVFLYRSRHRGLGTTIMRGEQLADLYSRHVNDRQVSFDPMEFSGPRDSIVILTKAAGMILDRLPSPARSLFLNRLRRRGNRIVVDPVDGRLPRFALEYADLALAASLAGLDAIREDHPEVRAELVLHHVDPRIEAMQIAPPDAFCTRYFGEFFNTLMTPTLQQRIEYVEVSTGRPSSDWLGKIQGTALHFAVRQRLNGDWVKPFTKGFVAAHSGGVILVHESETEAIRWLGESYPFILRGAIDEAAVLRALDQAQMAWGTPTWAAARASVAQLQAPSSGAAVARQLSDALSALD